MKLKHSEEVKKRLRMFWMGRKAGSRKAVEEYIYRTLRGQRVTQGHIAEKHGVALSTMSKNFIRTVRDREMFRTYMELYERRGQVGKGVFFEIDTEAMVGIALGLLERGQAGKGALQVAPPLRPVKGGVCITSGHALSHSSRHLPPNHTPRKSAGEEEKQDASNKGRTCGSH